MWDTISCHSADYCVHHESGAFRRATRCYRLTLPGAPDAGPTRWPAPFTRRGFAALTYPGPGRSSSRKQEGRSTPCTPSAESPNAWQPVPKGAISVSQETGAIVINDDICNGYRSCIGSCPRIQMGLNSIKSQAFKCDLCNGDPQCVRFYP